MAARGDREHRHFRTGELALRREARLRRRDCAAATIRAPGTTRRTTCWCGQAGPLAGFGDHLVEHRRAGELLPARLGDDAPELIGAVGGAEVRLRLPVRDVHPPVLSI